MNKSHVIFLLLLLLTTIIEAQTSTQIRTEYINTYADMAMQEMRRSGVPASITLAQGCLESADGTSMLAVKGKNHFGIKCHSSWQGKKIYKDDDRKNECFRVYTSHEDSYKDHSDFLKNGSRYAFLFELDQDDYKAWAKGLKKAGYATNPQYPEHLIKIIEENNLDKYDAIVLGKLKEDKKENKNSLSIDNKNLKKEKKPIQKNLTLRESSNTFEPPVLSDDSFFEVDGPGRKLHTNNGVDYIFVKYGDSFNSIAREYELSEWQIFYFNDFDKNHTLKIGEIVYIQPKKSKAEKKYNFHKVRKDENLNTISQLYAIKKNKLLKLNNLTETSVIKDGDSLKLRK